jgi:uncharacterized protein (TIGR03643 family)
VPGFFIPTPSLFGDKSNFYEPKGVTPPYLNMRAFNEQEKDRIIEMAWEDRTPFEAIKYQFGLNEDQVIELMRTEMKPSSFRMWRKRVSGRKTKHDKLSASGMTKFKSSWQKQISNNKISKRNP